MQSAIDNIKATYDYETCKEIVDHGCQSGVCHEHIYWDQGSALKQIGVLDAGNLPIAGAEAARKVLDVTRPSNIFMEETWDKSRNKPL